MSITYDSAVFVTDGESLIAIRDRTNDKAFAWLKLSWVLDRDFMCLISHLLQDKRNPNFVMGDSTFIPSEWLTSQHYLFTYHEWVAISQNFIKDYPLIKGTDDFSHFYRDSTQYSKERLEELMETVTGLYKVIEGNIYVIYAVKTPPWIEQRSSLENMFAFWQTLPKLDEILRQVKDEISTKKE